MLKYHISLFLLVSYFCCIVFTAIRGDVSRCMGRLSSGIPMVPPRRCENEYTSFRQSLPIWSSRDEIIQMISCHQTVLISGETGSGKTTQVFFYLLTKH